VQVTGFSSVASVPHVLVTSAADTSAKLFDYRQRCAVTTLQGHSRPLFGVALADIAGSLLCFTGGTLLSSTSAVLTRE
jgi:WD40 repeat protein